MALALGSTHLTTPVSVSASPAVQEEFQRVTPA